MRSLDYAIMLALHLTSLGCSNATLSDSGSSEKRKIEKQENASSGGTGTATFTAEDLDMSEDTLIASRPNLDQDLSFEEDGAVAPVSNATDSATATAVSGPPTEVLTFTDVNVDLPVAPLPTPPSTTTFTLLTNAGYAFPAVSSTATYLWSTQTVNASYYRNLKVSYDLDLSCAFLGYAPHPSAYFKNFCNNNVIRINPPAPSIARYTDNLTNCGSSTVSLQWGSGHFFCGSSLSVANIVMTGVKDPPVATSQSLEVAQNDATPYTSLKVSDPQGAPLTIRITAHPRRGTLLWSGSNFSYTPVRCYSGIDSFQYYVSENLRNLPSQVATVSINVRAGTGSGCP